MLEELKNKNCFFQDNPLFKKYFRYHQNTSKEEEKITEVYNLIKNFLDKTDIDFYYYMKIGYLENYGYYQMTYADRGWFDVIPLGEEPSDVFKFVINDVLMVLGDEYELKNREQLIMDFKKRFGHLNLMNKKTHKFILEDYFGLLYKTEYAITILDEYYDGNIPEEWVNDYTNYLNTIWWTKEQHVVWEYDCKNKRFNCQKARKYLVRRKIKNEKL